MQRSDLSCREITSVDIPMVQEWLKGWGKVPIEAGMYPDTGLVYYNSNDNIPIYIGFVWKSNSEMMQIGFVTRNPFYKIKLPKGIRKDFLLGLMHYAKDLGAKYIITWAESPLLVKDFKELGMLETSNQCSELILKI